MEKAKTLSRGRKRHNYRNISRARLACTKHRRVELPTSYYLDESDPDILILRRQDDSFVAAFSSRVATREGLIEAARDDYWRLLQAQTSEGEKTQEQDG